MPRTTSKKKQGSQKHQNNDSNPLGLRPISKNKPRIGSALDDFSKQVIRSFTQYLTAKKLNDRNKDDERSSLKIQGIKDWMKAESTDPDNALRIVDIALSLVINTKIKPEVFRNILDDFGLPPPPTLLGEEEKLDVTTQKALRHNVQQPTERENVSVKEQNKGYSSVVEDQFTLAGTPRIRAPKGAGRKKKPISLTMYQSDIDDVTEAAKLLGYPNRTEYLETIIKKHAKRTLNELKPTP